MKEVKNNKIKKAAALKYSPGENIAPKVVAIGKGETAEKIIEKAEENKVPIYKDENLAYALAELKIGDEIPPELYEIVAEILVFVTNLDEKYGDKYSGILNE